MKWAPVVTKAANYYTKEIKIRKRNQHLKEYGHMGGW